MTGHYNDKKVIIQPRRLQHTVSQSLILYKDLFISSQHKSVQLLRKRMGPPLQLPCFLIAHRPVLQIAHICLFKLLQIQIYIVSCQQGMHSLCRARWSSMVVQNPGCSPHQRGWPPQRSCPFSLSPFLFQVKSLHYRFAQFPFGL